MSTGQARSPVLWQEVQFVCLRMREDLIACQTAREDLDRKLRAEIHFYRSCVQSEQHAKATMEDELTQELDSLRTRLAATTWKHRGCVCGVAGELENAEQERAKEAALREQLEKKVQDLEIELAQCRMERSTEVGMLTAQQEELMAIKARLEEDLAEQRSKVQGLQNDLDNSESVQRDFVKLSQSLQHIEREGSLIERMCGQMQLETLRQSDTEVRWQHEDDIPNCQKCNKLFSFKKEKVGPWEH
ncbi:RABEP1 [Cordylochernes scorpioides]|uniref:RABEP1 n=1 Tax=Cordylochernes scorpioides TaxID=51811 RepID=A0ABY6KM65_9ARAC|nr:RABEP1 [Cordylochernes scorpioides]